MPSKAKRRAPPFSTAMRRVSPAARKVKAQTHTSGVVEEGTGRMRSMAERKSAYAKAQRTASGRASDGIFGGRKFWRHCRRAAKKYSKQSKDARRPTKFSRCRAVDSVYTVGRKTARTSARSQEKKGLQ